MRLGSGRGRGASRERAEGMDESRVARGRTDSLAGEAAESPGDDGDFFRSERHRDDAHGDENLPHAEPERHGRGGGGVAAAAAREGVRRNRVGRGQEVRQVQFFFVSVDRGEIEGARHTGPRARLVVDTSPPAFAMANEMTKEWLKAHCKESGGYGTPSLNDKLYLHFKGFDRIQNLEEYTGLKSIFLEGNGLEDLTGLEACLELRCLFAQQNMIFAIPPTLPKSLSTLNVSNNNISSLDNVSTLPDLETLQASHCKLKDLDAIRDLRNCPALTCVDLQQNKIDGDPEEMVRLFASVPKLACLYLQGNPIVSSLRQYRKRMISEIPGLAYLDDRPVFPLERLCAEAWAKGGLDAEKAARKEYKDAEEAKQRRDHEYLTEVREAARAKREALAEQGKRALADLGISDDSDGEWEPEPEPPELVAARERLARYEARPGEEEPPELTAARARATRGGATNETKPWEPLSGTRGESAERGCDEGTCDTGTCDTGTCAGRGPGSEAAEAVEEAVEEAEAMHAEEADETAAAAEGAEDNDENAAPSSDVGEKRAATRADETSFLDELD